MKVRRRPRLPMLSVVIPAYDVAAWLPACLDSVLAQTWERFEVVVVDDGSPDDSGAVAAAYADRDARLRVVRTDNHGLGAARNEGLRHASGEYVAFVDSDDVVPPGAWQTLVGTIHESGSDLVTGSVLRWEGEELREPPWMRRLHRERRRGLQVDDHPEIMGDVFAWNKVFRRAFWDHEGLSWPEGVRYEDQPTTTRAFLRGRFDVVPDVVYQWRIREDGTSITQQRRTVGDLTDRWTTKRMAKAAVDAAKVTGHTRAVFLDRVLAGDLHRYLVEIPGCTDEWWTLLRGGVLELWDSRSLVESGLPPVHRLAGWLVEQDRRADAAAVIEYAAARGRPLAQVHDGPGSPRLDVPVLDIDTVDPRALALRDHELRPVHARS